MSAIAKICIALLAASCVSAARAGDFSTIHVFAGGSDGEQPLGVVRDAQGNLYGTTFAGGNEKCPCGTVFKIAPDGTYTILHVFKGKSDGAHPASYLMIDGAGNLYGTTFGTGGVPATVFKLDTNGHLRTLHAFKRAGDGKNPARGVMMDGQGNLYGTTIQGGQWGRGTVYKIATDGRESVLHSFASLVQGDGDGPGSELTLDRDGNLYGTTEFGGSDNCTHVGCGTIYKIAPDGTYSIVYEFLGGSDGEMPVGVMARDRQGNLYGLTEKGGAGDHGTIFKFAPDGTKTKLRNLDIATGAVPLWGGLTIDRKGNLYGTAQGGANGQGVVFTLKADGTYKVLYDFTGEADGGDPVGLITIGAGGKLYGSTSRGGEPGCSSFGWGCGTVFEIDR